MVGRVGTGYGSRKGQGARWKASTKTKRKRRPHLPAQCGTVRRRGARPRRPLVLTAQASARRGRRRGPHGVILVEPAPPGASGMSGAEADRWAWLLVLSFVFGCNVLRILLPSFSSFMSRLLQKDAEQEAQMRAEIQDMKQELSTVNMMDEFARYARLERKINKMTDKLKTHVKARTAQLAKIKWVISVAFYILQAALMVSLIWKYYSVPVAVVPSKWITPLDRLVAFPTRVAGGVGITCWILVCNKVVAIVLHPFS
ncbi:guided entry of tail-anchored proteins factor 1 isoform X1 [Ursus americanus]|uniref:guided entry of tail-anchored proteins factor 1 isoform X1 n=1 Tax=Ursus americanus TaxID=9643 RepID=UPI001E67A8A9|nr:guided entry of tail-anchored proteins factor 1 isoform X1 [Ursus americanus]